VKTKLYNDCKWRAVDDKDVGNVQIGRQVPKLRRGFLLPFSELQSSSAGLETGILQDWRLEYYRTGD